VNTIYFWPDPPAAFAELRRVLCDDGRLVVGFGPRETMQALQVTKHGFTLHDPVDIVRHLSTVGFEDVTTLVGSGQQDGCVCVVGRCGAGW
jgi:arsenite methyltransferase